jgi:hypothetical protein
LKAKSDAFYKDAFYKYDLRKEFGLPPVKKNHAKINGQD